MPQRQHEESEADGNAEDGSGDDGASRREGTNISGSPTQHSCAWLARKRPALLSAGSHKRSAFLSTAEWSFRSVSACSEPNLKRGAPVSSALCGADVRQCSGAAARASEAPQPAQGLFGLVEGERSRDEKNLERVHPNDWQQYQRRKDHHREGTAAHDEEGDEDSDCQPFAAEPDQADALAR